MMTPQLTCTDDRRRQRLLAETNCPINGIEYVKATVDDQGKPQLEVEFHVLSAGSKSSTLARLAPPSAIPPSNSTCPDGSNVALCAARAVRSVATCLSDRVVSFGPEAGWPSSAKLARLPIRKPVLKDIRCLRIE